MNGVANNVKIMVLRAVPDGDEYDKDIALAIRYAVDNGAKIINTSFGKYFLQIQNGLPMPLSMQLKTMFWLWMHLEMKAWILKLTESIQMTSIRMPLPKFQTIS